MSSLRLRDRCWLCKWRRQIWKWIRLLLQLLQLLSIAWEGRDLLCTCTGVRLGCHIQIEVSNEAIDSRSGERRILERRLLLEPLVCCRG